MAGKKRSRNSSAEAVGVEARSGGESGEESVVERTSSDVVTHTRARAEWRNDERISALVAMLELGIPTVAACAKLAIPRRSLYDAMEADEALRQRIEDARATWEADYVRGIATDPDWKAKAWVLERRIPKRWAPPKERKEVTGANGGPVKLASVDVVDRMSDAELAEAARTLLGSGE